MDKGEKKMKVMNFPCKKNARRIKAKSVAMDRLKLETRKHVVESLKEEILNLSDKIIDDSTARSLRTKKKRAK